MAAGTLGFQSPEQLKGEGIGIHSDVYAELFGGEPLWSGLLSLKKVMMYSLRNSVNLKFLGSVLRSNYIFFVMDLSLAKSKNNIVLT